MYICLSQLFEQIQRVNNGLVWNSGVHTEGMETLLKDKILDFFFLRKQNYRVEFINFPFFGIKIFSQEF